MHEFLNFVIMFWGFVFFIIGLFAIRNRIIIFKVLKRVYKKIFLIGLSLTFLMFLASVFNLILPVKEMFALSIISSCWLVDLLNKARARVLSDISYGQFHLHDIVWGFSMIICLIWLCGSAIVGGFGILYVISRFFLAILTIWGSDWFSSKMTKCTF